MTLHRGAVAEVSIVTEGARTFVRKRLLEHASSSAEARESLAREARILRALDGRGAPKLIAFVDEGDVVAIDLALGPRDTLSSIGSAEARAHFPSLATAAWRALADVHEAADESGSLAIVHGDVSGPNVLVASDRAHCVLVDFQLASFRDGGPPHDGAFRGTAVTIAPEVARGDLPSQRADVFSMAASLLAAHAGAPLRDGEVPLAVLLVRAGEDALETSDLVARALAGVEDRHRAVLRRCLAHHPSARPSAREIVDELAARSI